ncbi:SpoIIE family protein phosphatase [Micromonospora sp. NPDC005367]|uniref:SpoIIE family protein phosphatase n=1 Tax=Micromonospora sp. NPDC005367 TaxID=3155590 RepID=UPI0033A8ED3A
MPHQAPENVYGNQNCNSTTVAHDPPSVPWRCEDLDPVREGPRHGRREERCSASAAAGEIELRPGDRLVVVTDGMRERNAADLDLPATLRSITGLHPREAVRALADAVLEVGGPTLADDATLFILDWHGGHREDRRASAGADQTRASTALPD